MDSRDASTEIDPHRFLGPDSQIDRSLENRPWTIAGSGSMVDLGLGNNNGRGLSPPGPINRTESPRRFGRSRTDTMVYSEAVNVAEELARGEGLFDADIDRAIAEQRTLGGSGQVAFPATTPEPTKPSAEETSQEYPATVPADVQNTSEHADTSHEEPTPAPLAQSILEIAEPAPTEPYIPVDAEEEEPLSPDEEDLPDATTAVPELSFSAAEEEEVEAQLGTTAEIRVEAPESERDAPSAIQPEAQPPQAESVKEEPSTQQTSEPEAKDDTDVSPDVILKQEDIPEEAETEGKEEKDESPKVVDHSEAAADTQVSPEPVPPSSSEDLNEVTEGKEIHEKLEVS